MLLSPAVTGVGKGLQLTLNRKIALVYRDDFNEGRTSLLLALLTMAEWTYPGFVESCELGIRVAVGVSSCPPVSWHSLVRPLGEPFFRPDPHIVRPSRAAAVKDGPFWGRPEGVSLTVVSTTAGWSASGATFRP